MNYGFGKEKKIGKNKIEKNVWKSYTGTCMKRNKDHAINKAAIKLTENLGKPLHINNW